MYQTSLQPIRNQGFYQLRSAQNATDGGNASSRAMYAANETGHPLVDEFGRVKDVVFDFLTPPESTNSVELTNKSNIAIDPGHGGEDPGALSRNGTLNEEDITLKISNFVDERITELTQGTENNPIVTLTRESDINPGGKGQTESLKARVESSKKAAVDTFVSIHVDSALDSNADRVSIFTTDNPNVASQSLSDSLAVQLKNVVSSSSGVVQKQANHFVTRNQNSNVAAVLVEVGFITNPQQEKLFQSDQYLRSIGNAIAEGIYYNTYPNHQR